MLLASCKLPKISTQFVMLITESMSYINAKSSWKYTFGHKLSDQSEGSSILQYTHVHPSTPKVKFETVFCAKNQSSNPIILSLQEVSEC